MTVAGTLVEFFCKIFANYTLGMRPQFVSSMVVECDVVHDG